MFKVNVKPNFKAEALFLLLVIFGRSPVNSTAEFVRVKLQEKSRSHKFHSLLSFTLLCRIYSFHLENDRENQGVLQKSEDQDIQPPCLCQVYTKKGQTS